MAVSPLNVFLVDEDPVFRLGLRIWLDQRSEFQVIGEAATAAAALKQLSDLQAAAIATATDAAASTASPPVNLVVIDLGLSQDDPDQLPGLSLCGEIKQQFPSVGVLVLSVSQEPVLKAVARQMGADGFGQRGLAERDLANLIRRVAAISQQRVEEPTEVAIPPVPVGLVAHLHNSSLQQIDAAMADIEQAATQRLPYWYRLVLAGKYRELRAARWLVQQILPLPQSPTNINPPNHLGGEAVSSAARGSVSTTGGAIVSANAPLPVAVGDVRTRVCEAVFRKLQFPLDNCSDRPLEIDILRADKSRELLYTILRVFESLLDDLQQASVPPGQLEAKTSTFLHDLWKTATVDFFGRYYTPPVDGLEQPMVAVLQDEASIVQAEFLDQIPEVPSLLAHLLFQASLEVDGSSYIATTPEALRRSQFLLENLLIQVGCAVMQPVLNRFADVESMKRNLYHRRIMSTREITRFRNDLSWRYRWDTLVHHPKAIFESEYHLFALTPQGIQCHRIYAPRREELEKLSGLQYMVTLALEARDAIAPRLRTTISWVGSGVVFVLTEVIGRGIGLVGRGVAKGIGHAWQDSRFRQRQRDEL
ncbi:MAG: DUF3685 domain-containing protein [Leptolyngbya sp. SIO1D8]|nr:DUF3685 domain-containing protein [Leptolyngbya sp. SIO1D8]